MAEYLIAYDITNPKRLARVHRALSKVAMPIEYSVFYAVLDPRQIVRHLAEISALIDPSSDDLRCYPLPAHGLKTRLGRATLPTGIHYTDLPDNWMDNGTQI